MQLCVHTYVINSFSSSAAPSSVKPLAGIRGADFHAGAADVAVHKVRACLNSSHNIDH